MGGEIFNLDLFEGDEHLSLLFSILMTICFGFPHEGQHFIVEALVTCSVWFIFLSEFCSFLIWLISDPFFLQLSFCIGPQQLPLICLSVISVQ